MNVRIDTSNPRYPLIRVDLPVPDQTALRYRAVSDEDGMTAFLAINAQGLASYSVHNPRNERGYGGSLQTYTLYDGSTRTVRGPWSSRCSVINAVFPDAAIVEVVLEPSRCAYGMRVSALEAAGLQFTRTEDHGEVRYELVNQA
jgi:hypothetical protein